MAVVALTRRRRDGVADLVRAGRIEALAAIFDTPPPSEAAAHVDAGAAPSIGTMGGSYRG